MEPSSPYVSSSPYVLFTQDYQSKSAGQRFFLQLVDGLVERGLRVFTVNDFPNAKKINKNGLARLENWIAFYDAGFVGATCPTRNPLNAKRIVRWSGTPYGLFGFEYEHSDGELFFTWDTKIHLDGELLAWDILEHDLFFHDGSEDRKYDVFYYGKGKYRVGSKSSFTNGMIEIDSRFPSTRTDLAKLLRMTKTFYSYDDNTLLLYEAIECGCEVIILPEEYQFTAKDLNHDSTSYDKDKMIDKFVSITQSFWKD